MDLDIKAIPSFEKAICDNYNPDHYVGFRIIEYSEEKYYLGENNAYYNLIFMLNGELEISYDSFFKRKFQKGDLIFIPPGTEIFTNSSANMRLLILTFNNRMESVCDNCTLNHYTKRIANMTYDFSPLPITPQIQRFADVMVEYIETKAQCKYLDSLKQKELFAILPHNYSQKILCEFFYPIICNSINFRTKVMEASHEGIGINEIASKLGMSPRTFSRKFMAEFGEPARFWLIKQKAKYIKLKLLVPETTISDIILQYGFTDTSHFNKFCKEHYGCTPTELIKQLRENTSKNQKEM